MVKMTPKTQTVKDLVEEAKKRIVLLFVCCIGLAYLMSLTSSSVWINIPAAVLVIVLLRCISYDLDACRRNAGHTRASATNNLLQNQSPPSLDVPSQPSCEQTDWRRKVDSAVVEAAMDQLTRHLVAEWITDRWYSLITPDQDAPEELIKIMNGVLGEISIRAKDVNLIDLLTSDIVHLVCDHLELFRIIQAHIGEGALSKLSSDERDAKLKLTLASENKLHPALFSAEAERKVLQRFMDGLVSLTFKPEDLQCKFFRFIVRELLACAVMRPIMNLASPKFINERIESLALSFTNKDDKLIKASGSETKSRSSRSRSATDHFSGFLDRSISGVELVQLGPGHRRKTPLAEIETQPNGPPSIFPKESKHAYPELSAGVQLTKEIGQHPIQQGSKTNLVTDNYKFQSENAEGMETHNFDGKISQARRSSRGEWAQMLDIISRRKTQALAPEHFENMWTKGRNYKRKENADGLSKPVNNRLLSEAYDNAHARGKPSCGQQEHSSTTNSCVVERHPVCSQQINPGKDTLDTARENAGRPEQSLLGLHEHNNDDETSAKHMEIAEDSGSSYTSEDDENSTVTGLGTPGIKVWDSRNSRSGSTSQIRHPLENSESHQRHGNRSQLRYRRLFKTASARKRARSNSHGVDRWQELERTSFYLGDGQDILNSTQEEAVETEDSVDNHEVENHSRVYSGTKASSSADAAHVSCTVNLSSRNSESSHLDATLCSQQLRCKVLGANFVKSGSKTIAVYSISVTDNEHHTWSIKRRFQHFEELHRRLKDSFPEYYLSLPPKRFLSSSLDASFVYERCNLLDKYLKDLLSLPRVAESIEVWDFLSVDSQTYMFFNSLSIIETLSVDLDDGQYGKHVKVVENFMENKKAAVDQNQDKVATRLTESTSNSATSPVSDESRREGQHTEIESSMNKKKQHDGMHVSYSGSDSDIDRQRESFHLISSKGSAKNARADPDIFGAAEDASTIPSEWTPPNLSLPILNLVDVIFQLQDGGWIRRQAFWVAKQVLQLGMGDAFDDWLIEKIQLLRNEEIIASAIRRIEQILWPDGIFLTKHPRRGRPPAASKADLSAPHGGATVTLPKGVESEQREGKDNQLLLDQQMEESRRASFVRELMVENAPAALVGLVGRKEYERCAQDIYFFLQSAVCVKQLAYGLLEMLLLAAFPELHDIVNLCHTEKGSFGMIPQTR